MAEDLMVHLKQKEEIDPDQHDGSYELVRETVRALSKVDKDVLDYRDMNLLFFMTVGTFTKASTLENKKKRIDESHINQEEKQRLKNLLDKLMDNAQKGKYANSQGDGTIGMFGVGFASFAKFKTESKNYAEFIDMCTKILDEEDEEKIFNLVEETLKEPIQGVGIATVSQILHCLKPFVFPILNQGEGAGIAVYRKLGIKLVTPNDTTKYIENVRRIKEFRDNNFSFKNYRVFDTALWDYISDLAKPFTDIFTSVEEANWVFDFIAEVATKLQIDGPEDPRVSMSLRHGKKGIHFVYCHWLIAGFKYVRGAQLVVLSLLKEKATMYQEYYSEDFSLRPGDKEMALYVFPLKMIKDLDDELARAFDDSLKYIIERFQGYTRSPYKSKTRHYQELLEMVFDYDKRKELFEKGLIVSDETDLSYSFEQLMQDTYMEEDQIERFVKAINRKGQAIIYGPPGTGKTYVAEKLAQYLIEGDGFHDIVQFHPAYSYEDFIQGIRPQVREDNLLEYDLVPGRFMEFCERSAGIDGISVLIIDEINRANLSRVFGELMYLLEYRNAKMPLAGGKTLQIPSNVRIIGTMNTADRSIALVDYALRRRFAFLKLSPHYEVIKHFQENKGINPEGLIEVLKRLNREIGDPHYEVGHSFFLVDDLPTQIKDIWELEIYPYLEEYFFDQPAKLQNYTWHYVRDRLGL